MKKRLFILSTLLILTLLPGCGSKEAPSTDKEASQEEAEEEKAPPAPGEENWGTAPEFSAPLITTTPIRYLTVTVGSTEEEVNLTWFSPSEEDGQVYWTSADDTDFENASVFSTSAVPSETTDGYYVNRVTVTGLTPETEYIYQVGNEEALSPSYAYTTPAHSDTFRFTAVGDAQIGKPVEEVDRQKNNWHKLLNKVKYHFPDTSFLVSLGDQVNDFDDKEQYNAFLNQGVLYSLSLAPLKGNHEIGGPQFSEHFSLPNQSSLGTCDDDGDGDYWFTRGNALFMVLNTMDSSKWGEHSEFIASAVEANPDARWRIVFSHFSPYNAYESYLENAQNIRPYFLEFTSAYDIDLVMSGHDHSYVRTHFIKEDGSFTEYESPAVNPEGTLYLTLSSSTGSLYRRPTDQAEAAVSRKRDTPEVTDVQITPDNLKVSTYNAETWELMDEFEIQK
ncbi:MAG: metallophosphoesterase [Clostridiales bacterium]|nr:metallophosphoesterase [Clostridiales bacterium]